MQGELTMNIHFCLSCRREPDARKETFTATGLEGLEKGDMLMCYDDLTDHYMIVNQ